MTFLGALRSVLGNDARFEGRATRAEHWWWQPAMVIVALLVGGLILLWWYLKPGTPGPNRFGPDPRAA